MFTDNNSASARSATSTNISVRRTGLIVFSSRIFSVFTGLVFLVMMTRSLSTPQFGLWEVIIDIVVFASYPAGLVVFWATREIARGKMLGKTAVVMNMALSAAGVALYFLFALLTEARVSAPFTTLLFAVLLVPLSYWGQAINAAVYGHKPAALGYVVVISEITKLCAAYPLLLVYHVGIDGVVASVMVANLAQSAAATYFVREVNANPLDLSKGIKWLSDSWLPALTTLPYVLAIADTFVASIAAGSTNITGYYQAAFSIAQIAGYSMYLATALYPLLLKGGGDDVTTHALDLALLFGIPMAVGAAALARPLLFLLKSQYVEGSSALVILAFASLANTISYVLDQTLMGRERVDLQEGAGAKEYLRSNLVYVSVVNMVASLTYLAALFVVIVVGLRTSMPISTMLDLWGAAQLGAIGGFALVKLRRVRRGGKLAVTKSMGLYAAGSAMMGVVLYAAGSLISYRVSSAFFAGELAVVSLLAVAVYFGFLYAVEGSFRELVRAVLRPILD